MKSIWLIASLLTMLLIVLSSSLTVTQVQAAHRSSRSSFSEDFETGLDGWSSGIVQVDDTNNGIGVDEVGFFSLPGSFISLGGSTVEVATQSIVVNEGSFSLKNSISAAGGERVILAFLRDETFDSSFDPVELGTLSFDVFVASGGASSTGYRWELQLELRRADHTDPRGLHYEIGASGGIAVPGGFLPPRLFDIFLAGAPTEDVWLHFERNITADLVAKGNPGGVADPENFFVEKIIIRFIVPSGSKTIYLDDLRIGEEVIGLIKVDIDIKPSSYPNLINTKSKGKIPVAILSTSDFDVPTEVDPTSLTFGRTGDEDSLAFCNKSPEDVNRDGYDDLVCHFRTQDTDFQIGDSEGILRSRTKDSIPIEGKDSVRIVK